jgi:hypothetical protein
MGEERFEGIDGVAGAGQVAFQIRHHNVSSQGGKGSSGHGQAMAEGGEILPESMMKSRNDQHTVHFSGKQGKMGEEDMAQVGRIETATEQTQPPGPRG